MKESDKYIFRALWILNCRFVFWRLFLESAIIYSPLNIVQLMSSIIALAVSILYMDLVWVNKSYLTANRRLIKLILFVCSATSKSWLYNRVTSDNRIIEHADHVFLLLLWEVGHSELWKNDRCRVWNELARFARRTTKVLHFDDR